MTIHMQGLNWLRWDLKWTNSGSQRCLNKLTSDILFFNQASVKRHEDFDLTCVLYKKIGPQCVHAWPRDWRSILADKLNPIVPLMLLHTLCKPRKKLSLSFSAQLLYSLGQ